MDPWTSSRQSRQQVKPSYPQPVHPALGNLFGLAQVPPCPHTRLSSGRDCMWSRVIDYLHLQACAASWCRESAQYSFERLIDQLISFISKSWVYVFVANVYTEWILVPVVTLWYSGLWFECRGRCGMMRLECSGFETTTWIIHVQRVTMKLVLKHQVWSEDGRAELCPMC
jgi:hypothetical protein